jgi:aspartyl-tRNA(Asn)/glutamyl-tRNA(Gln) amidotransferase subunit A
MSELFELTATELLATYAGGEASPNDAVRSCLERIEQVDPAVNAVLTLLADQALEAAQESTRRWRHQTARTLEGVPVGIKDIIATAGMRTTGGSRLYSDHVPAESAIAVQRLEAAGAVILAKLQTYEFAMGARVSPWGDVRNPWNVERTTGGSSSGSAAAVAARELPLALGTDTGGSIRIPATLCGITGIKPTYGRVPRCGVMGLSWTLDHVGPMARSVADTALALGVIAGYDPRDPSAATAPVEDYVAGLTDGANGLRIGFVPWYFQFCDSGVQKSTLEAINTLKGAGVSVHEITLANCERHDLGQLIRLIIGPEMASLHEANFGQLGGYSEDFAEYLIGAQFINAIDYLRALRMRSLVQQDFEAAFETVDAIVVPGTVAGAPKLDGQALEIRDRMVPWQNAIGRTTGVFSIAGIPALALPTGLDKSGMPIGIQIAARPYAETTCFRLGHVYQQLTDHHKAAPQPAPMA